MKFITLTVFGLAALALDGTNFAVSSQTLLRRTLSSGTEECGGHGHIHPGETECECDYGYGLITIPDSSSTTCTALPCSGHGVVHEDHCDCDSGYITDPSNAQICLSANGIPTPSTNEDECGGHGHLHDGECHCDEGYTPVFDICVPLVCSGHGTLHEDHCDCDPGYGHDGDNEQVCIPLGAGEEECGGHGHLHGSVCHCDEGYITSTDGKTCVRVA